MFFVPRVSIFWGGYSQINANLRLPEAAVQEPYEYYHYFRGSDFPLKTKDEVDRFFEANVGREFITSCVWEKANSPRTFVEDDFEQLIHVGEDICFARKFNEQYDLAIVEKLFRYLQKKQYEEEV